MKTWKSKLFGDNRMNFYGWIAAGLVAMGASLFCVGSALFAGGIRSPECLLLLGIYIILLGHFGIALQNYHARVAKSIESAEGKGNDADEANKE